MFVTQYKTKGNINVSLMWFSNFLLLLDWLRFRRKTENKYKVVPQSQKISINLAKVLHSSISIFALYIYIYIYIYIRFLVDEMIRFYTLASLKCSKNLCKLIYSFRSVICTPLTQTHTGILFFFLDRECHIYLEQNDSKRTYAR